MTDKTPAILVLADGRTFRGDGFGATGTTLGEAVFTTAMTGYQETMTDPSYHRQIVVSAAPHIGNTGWNDEDNESHGNNIWVAGLVIRDLSRRVSSWRAERSLSEEMQAQGVIGIRGIDTRTLVRHLRNYGSISAGLFSGEHAHLGIAARHHAESVWAKSQALGLCDVHPVGSITKGLEGKSLTEFGMMARSDAKVRMFSDDGKCVQNPQLMRRALEYAKGMDVLLAQHAEDDRMTGGSSAHEGENAARLGLRGWPRVAEESIVARDALLARDYGNRVHICHASTQGTVELLQWAKEHDIPLTAGGAG